nr:MAG TPA: tail assembly protein [Caudoviricetes sp.]
MATYTVKKGDTLWSIASKYLGSGDRWLQLADRNGIPRNKPIIQVGQVIELDVGGVAAPSQVLSQKATTSRPGIKYFGLQAGTDKTVFAIWDWTRDYTDHYQVWWEYDAGNGLWFIGDASTTELKQSVYTAPSNSYGVRFCVKAFSQTHTVNDVEVNYWNGEWTTYLTYYFEENPPIVPTNLSLEIDNYKLTVEARYTTLVPEATGIQFQIVKDDETVFDTGNAELKTTVASYSCTITPGSKYKARCRSYRGYLYSEWSEYTSNTESMPDAPKSITTLRAESETSVYLEWEASGTAKTYEIEYATKLEYFDGSDATSTVSGIEYTHYQKTGLESGEEYFFRVRAANDKGTSGWTEIKSISIGKKPAAPTTWSSTTTTVIGEPLNLYWVHNAQDGSAESYAELELYIGDEKIIETVRKSTDEEEKYKTSVYAVNTSKYTEGIKIRWRVRTSGITKEYGDWSIQRTIDVYAPPTLTLNILDSHGKDIEVLESFPLYIRGFTGPNTQKPIGYYVTVVANSGYGITDGTGFKKTISKGGQIYSRYFDTSDPLMVELSAGNIILENNIEYTVKCIASMNSGLTAEASISFTVGWSDNVYEPSAEIGINKETLAAYIRPFCEYYPYIYYKVNYDGTSYIPTDEIIEASDGVSVDGALTSTGEIVYSGKLTSGNQVFFCARISKKGEPVQDVLLSVYRREFDGSLTELATGIENGQNTYITDPHPALDFARYRIVAITKTTGSVSYFDVPGYPVDEKAVIIQWDEEWQEFDVKEEKELSKKPWSGSLLKLPYNVDVSDSHSSDVSLVKYIGRKRPVSYYGTQLGETSNWKVEIAREDVDTLYALRRLSAYMGDVYVREPSGTGYWASISVSISQTHCEVTTPVEISVTRVEGGK